MVLPPASMSVLAWFSGVILTGPAEVKKTFGSPPAWASATIPNENTAPEQSVSRITFIPTSPRTKKLFPNTIPNLYFPSFDSHRLLLVSQNSIVEEEFFLVAGRQRHRSAYYFCPVKLILVPVDLAVRECLLRHSPIQEFVSHQHIPVPVEHRR